VTVIFNLEFGSYVVSITLNYIINSLVSALDVNFNVMYSINSGFTYLLTYFVHIST